MGRPKTPTHTREVWQGHTQDTDTHLPDYFSMYVPFPTQPDWRDCTLCWKAIQEDFPIKIFRTELSNTPGQFPIILGFQIINYLLGCFTFDFQQTTPPVRSGQPFKTKTQPTVLPCKKEEETFRLFEEPVLKEGCLPRPAFAATSYFEVFWKRSVYFREEESRENDHR